MRSPANGQAGTFFMIELAQMAAAGVSLSFSRGCGREDRIRSKNLREGGKFSSPGRPAPRNFTALADDRTAGGH